MTRVKRRADVAEARARGEGTSVGGHPSRLSDTAVLYSPPLPLLAPGGEVAAGSSFPWSNLVVVQ